MLGLDFLPADGGARGVLQMIPFFGPFVSWAPPVVVAVLTKPDAVVRRSSIVMAVGWFVVNNIVAAAGDGAGGRHPPGRGAGLGPDRPQVAGIAGAIFALPVAAVISAFFFHYLNAHRGAGRAT